MARRSAAATVDALAATPKAPARGLRVVKQFLAATLIVGAVLASVWAYSTVDHFLVSDPRFFLPGPPEPGEKSRFFRIEGARNVTAEQVTQVFGRDFGRSVYLCPLQDRRLKLLGIDWIKDASISRLWPNRLVVRISERMPVAFTQMTAVDGTVLLWLIDGDGVLLDPQQARPYRLPVLVGITRADSEVKRRERMKRFIRMQSDLVEYMPKISEIDVANLDNFKVIQQFDGRALTLMLGNQSFRSRYENFLNNHDEIRRRLPNATVLDLRLKDRITAVATGNSGGAQ